MRKILVFLLSFIASDAFACRAPYVASGKIIKFQYLEEKGSYKVIAPAYVGQSEIKSVSIFFTQKGLSSSSTREQQYDITGKVVVDSWVGVLHLISSTAHDSWIEVIWDTEKCPTVAKKKVKLFEFST